MMTAAVVRESWLTKKSRIRSASPYGHLANWDVSTDTAPFTERMAAHDRLVFIVSVSDCQNGCRSSSRADGRSAYPGTVSILSHWHRIDHLDDGLWNVQLILGLRLHRYLIKYGKLRNAAAG